MTKIPEKYSSYKLTVFNPNKVEHQIRANPTRALAINEIVDRLINQGSLPLTNATKAMHQGRPTQAIQIIRQLKHSVINFGAMRVCDIATDIEELLANSPFDDTFDLFMEAFESELALFLQQARTWREQQLAEFSNQLHQAKQNQRQHLQQLLTLLHDHNMRALDIYESLRDSLSDNIAEAYLMQIDECLVKLEFDEALQLLQRCEALNTLEQATEEARC